MTKENHHQGIYIGAAVVAGILGTLSALMNSNRKVQEWTGQAKDVAQQVLEKGEMINKKMVLGGVAGGLIGAAAALLLAPKSGAELIKDLSHPFSHQGEHGRSTSRKSASRKSVAHKKGVRSARSGATHKATAKTAEHKSHKASAKKKSPNRRRTATALKQAATVAENRISEASEAAT